MSLKNVPRHIMARLFSKFKKQIKLTGPVVSFTFDDFPVTAVTCGSKILDKYGAKGTFYISFGLCGKETSVGTIAIIEQINSLLAEGHELGCHTFSHVDTWVEPISKFKESIDMNKKALKEYFPSMEFLSFAYPKGSATSAGKKIVGEQFVTGRGIYWGINKNKTDLNLLHACELYCTSTQSTMYQKFIDLIDQCIRRNGWLIFLTHDISDNPSPYGCTPAVLQSLIEYCIKNGIAIKPIKDIVAER